MQDTLDPTVGQSEIQELKKEIHRMELRLDGNIYNLVIYLKYFSLILKF